MRHARGATPIRRDTGTHVKYYLFAPQGSGEAESLTPLKWRTNPLPYTLVRASRMRVEDGVPASETAVADKSDDLKITACRFDRRVGRDKIVKLPSRGSGS